jgi:hypothetical protein
LREEEFEFARLMMDIMIPPENLGSVEESRV